MELQTTCFLLLPLLFLVMTTSPSNAARALIGSPSPSSSSFSKIKAVNLGGWLVTEGWIKPSLFDAIPNKDLLDGTQLQFKSVTQNMYLCAESGGGTVIVANRSSASGWETFKLWRITENSFKFRVFNKQFVGLDVNEDAVAVSDSPDAVGTTFEIVRNAGNANLVRIKAPNGLYLQAKTPVSVTADFPESTDWGSDDPSVFLMNIVATMRGEFQLTNGYGTDKATPVLREHWSSFIVEEDFEFISQNGLNGVRIPVGWWIASDPTPPWPYVGGSLEALDNAFSWSEKYGLQVIIDLHAAPGSQNGNEHSASRDGSQDWGTTDENIDQTVQVIDFLAARKYGLKVIIDLHAAPGSQNGNEHSASRDGSQDWGTTDENIDQTVQVIDFLAARYAKMSSLLAIELINEPVAPGVTLANLEKYYEAGYNAVRKYSPDAFVIMSNRLSAPSTELLQFANGFQGSVVDFHYYNLYSDVFDTMTAQQNIDYVNTNRSADLSAVTRANGPLIFVGEWVAEWQVQGATKEEFQKFAAAELNVFGRATFGWSYWTLKNVNNHWSLEWMITNGYITL